MREICKVICEWKCTQMWLGNNRCSNIIRDLERVDFSCLKLISLRFNGIESVERLNRAKMPMLQQIYLSKNLSNTRLEHDHQHKKFKENLMEIIGFVKDK